MRLVERLVDIRIDIDRLRLALAIRRRYYIGILELKQKCRNSTGESRHGGPSRTVRDVRMVSNAAINTWSVTSLSMA